MDQFDSSTVLLVAAVVAQFSEVFLRNRRPGIWRPRAVGSIRKPGIAAADTGRYMDLVPRLEPLLANIKIQQLKSRSEYITRLKLLD